jgi:SAM-dependent methyltransferase
MTNRPESVFPLRPGLSLPNGLPEDKIYNFLRSIRPADAPVTEMANYCEQDWRRFVYTWGLVSNLTGDCLELGSNPYFTTLLIKQFTQLRLTLANYFSPQNDREGAQQVIYRDSHSGEIKNELLNYHHFSVESDPFPFSSNSFEVVLFCEIIEHLQIDPVAALREIHRVLKPGGVLVLTTPNVSRVENVARMISGENIYDPYSAYGTYGRHNREYNKHELQILLKYCGFDVETMFSADVHNNRAAEFCRLHSLVPLLRFRELDLGQYIFVRCYRRHAPAAKRPAWLYRSYPEGDLE